MIDEITKEHKKIGPKEKYNPSLHDLKVKEILGSGKFKEDFCKKYDISNSTFYGWMKKFPSFKEAVEKCQQAGEAFWTNMPIPFQERSFSYPYWSWIMKNKYGVGKPNAPEIKGIDSPTQIITKVIQLFVEGRLSESQVDRLTTLASAKIKAIQCDSQEERIAKLEEIAKCHFTPKE